MPPQDQVQGRQLSDNWGNPSWVTNLRTQLLTPDPKTGKTSGGVDDVDRYIQQNAAAYQQQQSQNVTKTIGNTQGGVITADQAQQDPTGALSFLKGGGKLLNVGIPAQAKAVSDANDYFSKHADKSGYVAPQDYNKFLGQYAGAGGNTADFNSKFADKYTNPNNIMYDTPEGKQAQKALPVIKQVLDSYHNLHMTGAAVKDLSSILIVGPYIQQNFFHQQAAHDAFLRGQAAQLRSIAGAGQGQGLRSMPYLSSIADLLPSSEINKQEANDKISELDTLLKNNMGVQGGIKSLYGK